jgi:transcriptional regulator
VPAGVLHRAHTPLTAASDLYTGTLDVLILKAVNWGPRHGYAIGRWIRETTDDVLVVQEGALYPALHRLERQGLLAEEWRLTDTGRQAKFYTLTRAGRAKLRAESARWSQYAKAVTRALAASSA